MRDNYHIRLFSIILSYDNYHISKLRIILD